MKQYLCTLCLLIALGGVLFSCEKTFDYNPSDVPPFAGLSAPAPGEGYQVHVPPFPVPAHFEREFFMRMPIGNTTDIYVNRFRSRCRPGTHHLIAYGYEDENKADNPPIGVMRDQNLTDGQVNYSLTMGSGAMYYLTQVPDYELELPPGIAVKIPANATIDLNSHYFNITDEIRFGEVFLNFHTLQQDSVVETLVVESVDNDEVLVLPKRQTTDIEYEETYDEPLQIRMMVSHMHKRGVQFDVYIVGGSRDGELVYSAYDYQHPPTTFFDPPLQLAAGQGLRTVVRYYNETNREIRFGVTSEDEMGILFFMKTEN